MQESLDQLDFALNGMDDFLPLLDIPSPSTVCEDEPLRLPTGRFLCPDPKCHKEFKRNYTCKVHYRATHLNLRPFKCPQCSKQFARKYDMKRHISKVAH
ncbi:hypothetical protein EDD86DRAFT_198350 [Gorgonomyces haynaldii]|nr:hypothetical protein EDD86DRAFT_198350 [Gorgonomyces haynaldii]